MDALSLDQLDGYNASGLELSVGKITDLDDGWKHFEINITVNAVNVASMNRIELYYVHACSSENILYVDNISYKRNADKTGTPKIVTYDYTFYKATPEDISLNVEMNGIEDFTLLFNDTELEKNDYSFEKGIITIKKEYLSGCINGAGDLRINYDGGSSVLTITIVPIQPAIPDLSNYVKREIMTQGSFENFDEGYVIPDEIECDDKYYSISSYDAPSYIVVKDGSKVLKFSQDKAGTAKSYSSMLFELKESLVLGKVYTVSFDWLLDVDNKDLYTGFDDGNGRNEFCFTNSAGSSHLVIDLDGSNKKTTTGQNNYKWEISYENAQNGWVKVTCTFVVDNGLAGMTHGRFLFSNVAGAGSGDAMYIDNFSMSVWEEETIDETPIVTETVSEYTKGGNDVIIHIDLKGLNLSKVARKGSDKVSLNNKAYELSEDGKILTMKGDYLKTLEAGDYDYEITTFGGVAEFRITVKEADTGKKGCKSSVTGTCLSMLVILFGFVVVIRKKENA